MPAPTSKKPGRIRPGSRPAIVVVLLDNARKPVDERGNTKTKSSENSRGSHYIDHEKRSILSDVPHMSTLTFPGAPGRIRLQELAASDRKQSPNSNTIAGLVQTAYLIRPYVELPPDRINTCLLPYLELLRFCGCFLSILERFA